MPEAFAAIVFKLRIKILFWSAAIFFLISPVTAERLPIKIYTSADGFGTSASFALVRDERGFLWLCSRDGLVRFDGYRFLTYRIGDELADTAVLDLVPTRAGVYWINLNRGTDYRFNLQSDEQLVEPAGQTGVKNDYRIPLKVEPVGDELFPSIEDEAGNLFAIDNKGIFLGREKDGRIAYEPLELDFFKNQGRRTSPVIFGKSGDGGVWMGTNRGLARRFPDGRIVYFSIDTGQNAEDVRFYAEDNENRVWIARSNGLMVLKTGKSSELNQAFYDTAVKPGVVKADGIPVLPDKPGEAFLFAFDDVFLQKETGEGDAKKSPLPAIYQMICASDGKMWISTRRGLVVFDGNRFRHYTTRNGLATNLLSSLVEDKEGYIWVVSYGGLHRINPKGLVTFDESDNFSSEVVHSIYEKADGELQIVSGDFNISNLERDGKFKSARPLLPANETVLWQSNVALIDSRGDWWLTTNKNVYKFEGVKSVEDLDGRKPSYVFNSKNGLIANTNVRIFEDSRGDVWISTNPAVERYGLTRWERATGKFQQFSGAADGLPEEAFAIGFTEDRAGNLWFGFGNGEVARFRDGRFSILTELKVANSSVTSMFRDSRGRIWISSNREGLIRVDDPESERPTFRRYSIADGLTSNNTRCVTEDLYGNIYIGTVRGVNRLSPDTGRIKYYGTADGLASDFVNAALRDRTGAIWFGTYNGLSKIVPEADKAASEPSVLISGLRIAGEDYSVSPLGQKTVFAPHQTSDRNNLQIDFLSVTTDATTRYQYRLEGVDAEWSQPSLERSVTFANLSPGAYRFLVRAVNADGAASEQPAVVAFTVLRPIWQRWWFLAIVSVVVVLLIYALYNYRIRQIIKLERVRTRIATDLHDDIGSSLSKIAILSEVVRQKTGGNGASEPLEIIANTSREMVDSMSDIVWAINPNRDSLKDLIQRMRRFAEDIFDAQDIDYEFVVPESQREISLGADVRRDVYLIFKEAVNNLAKYSQATSAEIKIQLNGDKLTIEIKDNGRGFLVPSIHATVDTNLENGFGGNGLRNMRKRTLNFGGDLQIDSEIGKGTRIELSVPVHKNIFAI